ncbi:hypothetical protein GQ55_3G468600 [Panicum hallii var. hallii]|uniref:Uncharacterized protein n=1 Tax=Panicum hallii var. hallii TaxID=1504633 RepID=A0A2T7EJ70_9POAL|nr:hypothetical protein GQ55_3G468600 [Panicum hallii var. hallii]
MSSRVREGGTGGCGGGRRGRRRAGTEVWAAVKTCPPDWASSRGHASSRRPLAASARPRSPRRPTPVRHSPAPWGCAGGRPSPPRLPPVPTPAAAALHEARLRSAVCAAGGSTRRPVRLRPRLPRAVERWLAAAPLVASHRPAATAAGALTPQPTARLAESPTPNGHQLQEVHGRRQGHPAAHTPKASIR